MLQPAICYHEQSRFDPRGVRASLSTSSNCGTRVRSRGVAYQNQCLVQCQTDSKLCTCDHLKFCTVYTLQWIAIATENNRLYQMLFIEAEIAEPVFALSWLITWFAHDLQDPVQVCRVYDLCGAQRVSYILTVSSFAQS